MISIFQSLCFMVSVRATELKFGELTRILARAPLTKNFQELLYAVQRIWHINPKETVLSVSRLSPKQGMKYNLQLIVVDSILEYYFTVGKYNVSQESFSSLWLKSSTAQDAPSSYSQHIFLPALK